MGKILMCMISFDLFGKEAVMIGLRRHRLNSIMGSIHSSVSLMNLN